MVGLLQQAVAQNRQISGRVTDRSTGQGLPGVTVLVKGTTTGATTNSDGAYLINVPTDAATLTFSSIGYVNLERAVGSAATIDVALAADTKQLGEVVVSALGLEQRRDEQGTATSRVSGNAVTQSGETSVITGLAGKASGVQITRSSGDPGAGAYIQIRGQNTITGNVQPLIVVDGTPISNSTLGGGVDGVTQQSRLNDINPNDIASIQVLKGASAAALWGSRAASGVLIITTKKGSTAAGKLSVTYGATYSLDKISYQHDLQQSYGRGSGGVAAIGTTNPTTGFTGTNNNANSWGDKLSSRAGGPDDVNTTGAYFQAADGTRYYPVTKKNDRTSYLDKNFDGVFQTGHFLENNLSLSAGDKDGNIFISLSDLNQEGIIRQGSDYRRSTARVNAEKRFNNIVRLGGNFTYSKINSNRIQQGSNTSGLYLGFLRQAPDFDQEDFIGTYFDASGAPFLNRQRSYRRQLGETASPAYNNALWTTREQKNPNEVDRFLGTVELGLDPRPWLNFTARVGADAYTDYRTSFFPKNSAQNNANGEATEQTITETQYNADFFGRASHSFGAKFSGNILAGINFNQRRFQNLGATYRNFILDERQGQSYFNNSTNANRIAFDSESKRRNSRGYATIGLVFNEQLFLNGTAAAEAASTFGPQTESLFFYPSVDVAWQFTKLGLLSENRILSFGKLRAAYGEVGVEPGVYVVNDIYQAASFTESYGPFLDASAYAGSFARNDVRRNPFLKPERKREAELGLDLRFIQDRISLSGTYYQTKTVDAIFDVPVATSSGYYQETSNAGTIQNKGIEIDLGADIIKTDNFVWNVGGNWTRNRNKVLSLAGTESLFLAGFTGVSSRAVEGQPLGVLWGGRYERNEDGTIVTDTDGFPVNADTEGIIGDPNPKWRSGLNTTLSYKGLRLFALLETSFGGDIWAGTEGVLRTFGTSKFTDVETTLSAVDAAAIKTYTGQTVAQAYRPNSDGSYTFRGRVDRFGNGPQVALDESWYTTDGGGFGVNGEQFIQDATWTRLRELTLGYTLRSEKFRSLTRLSNIELTLTGRNLLLFTKEFKGVDPETNLTGPTNGRGLEYFNNPGTRSFLIGLRVTY